MKSLKLTGSTDKTYDLDEIAGGQSRLNSETQLLVQVWEWNPDGVEKFRDTPEYEAHKLPNPPNLVTGQIWLSKRV